MDFDITYRCMPSTRHVKVLIADSKETGRERGNIVRVEKADAIKRQAVFTIGDLQKDRAYYVELVALDGKHSLIDKSYIIVDTSGAELKADINVLSGLWAIDRRVSFNFLSGDSNTYTKLLVEPVKRPWYTVSHDCFLISDGGKTKLHPISYYYDPFPRLYVSGHVEGFAYGKPMRTIGVDNRQWQTADGVFGGFFVDRINALMSSPCVFSSPDKVKLLLFEFVIKRDIKNEKISDKKGKVASKVAEYKALMRSVGDPVVTDGFPVVAKNAAHVDFHRECKSPYKIFCREADIENLEIDLDVGDLYIYPLKLERVT